MSPTIDVLPWVSNVEITWTDRAIDDLTRGVCAGHPLVLRGAEAVQCIALTRAGLFVVRALGGAIADFFNGVREWKALPESDCSGCQRRQVALEDATRVIGKLGNDVASAKRETVEAREESTRWVARMRRLERVRDDAVEVLEGRRKVGNHG